MPKLLIGDRLLDLEKMELLDHLGDSIYLRSQSLKVLLLLAHNSDSVVSKDEIIENVWREIVVTDDSIVQCIRDIRNALGAAGKSNLQTFPRRGYKLIVDGEVEDSLSEAKTSDIQQENFLTPLTTPEERASIAVLPFKFISNGLYREEFADGICEDIINALSRITWFFVISRTSSFTYKDKNLDVKQIGSDLNVRYLLEGSVQVRGLNLRVTANLIDVYRGVNIWSDSYSSKVENFWEIQDDITKSIVASLYTQVQISEGFESASQIASKEKDPLAIWLQLNKAWSRVYQATPRSLEEAINLATECVARHPDNSRAYKILAAALFHRAWMGFSEDVTSDFKLALTAAENAVFHDSQSEYAHWILGLSSMMDGNHDHAIAALERAIYLNPNCSLAYGSLGTVQNYAGLPELAIVNNQIAMRSNPRDPSIFYRYAGMSLSYFLQERFELAITWARQAIAAKPSFAQAHLILIAALVDSGLDKEAMLALGQLKTKNPKVASSTLRSLPFRCSFQRDKFASSIAKAGSLD